MVLISNLSFLSIQRINQRTTRKKGLSMPTFSALPALPASANDPTPHILYFCGTIERNRDGVTRTLDELDRYNRSHQIPSYFVTAVGRTDDTTAPDYFSYITDFIEVSALTLPKPKYDGYKLSIASPFAIDRALGKRAFVPSLVHVHSPCTLGLAGISLARRHGIPVVATYHTHFPSYFRYHNAPALEQPARAYLRYFYNRCDATFVPSKTLLAELKADGVENAYYLPHGVDTNVFHPLHRSHEWRKGLLGERFRTGKILLYVGRLVWEKNLRVMVEALMPLLRENPDAVLAIAGTGSAEAELRELLSAVLPKEQVHFLGFQTGSALSAIYASSDVFIFPSDTETFGNVTLEALASGLPCVVANAGGSLDLVRDGENGFIADAHDPHQFRAACERLLNDDTLRHTMSHKAFLSAQQSSWTEIHRTLHALYAQIQERHNQNHDQQSHHAAQRERFGSALQFVQSATRVQAIYRRNLLRRARRLLSTALKGNQN
jgi:phosphatidylinositol alpha 1,6-mannosyltransferase